MTGPVCSRDGCAAALPALAVKHGDGFCSAACARLDHGVTSPEQEAVAATRSEHSLLAGEQGWRVRHRRTWARKHGTNP